MVILSADQARAIGVGAIILDENIDLLGMDRVTASVIIQWAMRQQDCAVINENNEHLFEWMVREIDDLIRGKKSPRVLNYTKAFTPVLESLNEICWAIKIDEITVPEVGE
jgi:hypothetical protein